MIRQPTDSPVIDVEVEGAPRNLQPVVRDEAYRIAGEALRNAFRHAQAQRITVEIRYDKRQFRLDGSAMTGRALTWIPCNAARRTLRAATACVSGPKSSAEDWRSGASSIPARRSS